VPEVTIATETKKTSDGTTATYTYYRSTWTDAEGKRHFVRLGNADVVTKAEAERRLIAAIAEPKQATSAAITVKQWCEGLLADMNVETSTASQYRIAIRQALECWGEHKRLRQVTTQDVEKLVRWIREHPARGDEEVSDWTIRNRCTSLGALFERAKVHPSKDKPYIKHNPFDDAEVPSPSEAPEFVHVSLEQTRRLIETAPDANIRALIALTRLMALRFEEAMHVEPIHINWQLHAVVVALRENRQGKGKSTKQNKRMVPMSKAAYRLILDRFEELPEGYTGKLIDPTPLNRGAQGKPTRYMRRLLESAGILNLAKPFHDLRKSQAQDWSVLHGCENSARWCGHSIDVALKHYRANATEALGLVTGLDDPKAKLATAYSEFDAKVCRIGAE